MMILQMMLNPLQTAHQLGVAQGALAHAMQNGNFRQIPGLMMQVAMAQFQHVLAMRQQAQQGQQGQGGAGVANAQPNDSGNIAAAKGILRQIIMLVKGSAGFVNAIAQIAMNLTAKYLAELGKTYTQAELAEQASGNNQNQQEVRQLDAAMGTLGGMAENNLQWWKEVVKKDLVEAGKEGAEYIKT